MDTNFVLNGLASSAVADRFMASGGDPGALRPFLSEDGNSYVTVNQGGKPTVLRVRNANATLRKDEWKILDDAVVAAAKARLRTVADLRSRGLVYNIPNGMSKTILETEAQSDITAATMTMDGLAESQNDRPLYSLTGLPLPIIHKDFSYPARQVMTSRNGGSPLDTTSAAQAARRVLDYAEDLVIGNIAAYTFGGGSLYGYINSPARIPVTITSPVATGWTGGTTLADVLAMKSASQAQLHYGPWILYSGPDWDEYMDNDFSTAKGDLTLRNRLRMIEGIEDVRTLDNLSGYDLVLVQLTPDVVRLVLGMDVTTVQWEEKGGMQFNFKVMAIMVPQIREDFNGNTGIVHGTTV